MITHFLSPENIQKFLSLCPGGLAIIGVTWPRFTSPSIAARYGSGFLTLAAIRVRGKLDVSGCL